MYRGTGPRELWTEHLMSNPGSFSATASLDSDDWRTTASIGLMPARGGQSGTTAHATDTTAYATQPAEDSWYARYYGTLSPAKVSASATGRTVGGQLT
jgi:hypothetical protein